MKSQFLIQVVECRERGSALIVVLWTVLILAFAVAMASEKVALVLGDTSIRAKRLQAELLADSALSSLEVILNEDRQKFQESQNSSEGAAQRLNFRRFMGTWQSEIKELNGGSYWIELKDEHSKINWLKTPPDAWRYLFEIAGVMREASDAWFDSVADWEDADEAHSINGAETPDYQNLDEYKRRAKNAAIKDRGEIFWIKGGFKMMALRVPVDSQGKMEALFPMTTIYGDGKININTAPPILIAAVLNVTLEGAEDVVKKRSGPDGIAGNLDDIFLDGVPQGVASNPVHQKNNTTGQQEQQQTLASAITTVSDLFRVRGVGEFEGQRVVREALAKLEGESQLRLLQEPKTVEYGLVEKKDKN